MKVGQIDLEQNPFTVMGILNLTPDSFSDGGQFMDKEAAINHVARMIDDGADIIDIGGESTRPGATPLTEAEEIKRVVPVISVIKERFAVPVSIDTSKAGVMRAAVKAGADLINDVRALREEGALQAAVDLDVPVCLMHMQGQPRTMQQNPEYSDVLVEVKEFLQQRISQCENAGISRDKIMIDPGFGFGKSLSHNLSLLKHLDVFVDMDLPVLVGISRKSMLGAILDAEVDQRLAGGLATTVLGYRSGARLFRVHDVKPTVDALKVCTAVQSAR